MLSMTGYGRGEACHNSAKATVRLTSVNRKSLDIRVNVPRELAFVEASIRAVLGKRLARGAVTVAVELTGRAAAAHRLRIDRDLARILVQEADTLRQELGLTGDLRLQDLFNVPGLVTVEDAAIPEDAVIELVSAALEHALAGLEQTRRTEGETLTADLVNRRTRLEALVAAVHERAGAAVADYREKLHARVSELVDGLAVDDERLLKEVVVFADRSDITEELTRLNSHLGQMADLFRADGPVGRKLDFLIQEMVREINTVGAKSCDADIALHVIEFKAELDRIREQTHNIE